MNLLYSIFIGLFAFTQAKGVSVENTVQVQVYYETLCPYSIAFIIKQLYPVYQDLHEDINLELVPWGHASEEILANGTKNFTCQHGPDECYGNKIHSCALNLTDVETSTAFIACSEGGNSPTDDSTFEQCADTVGISWADIEECISTGKGNELLSENGKKTAVVNPAGVPMIVIDGLWTDEIEDQALTDFRSLVCALIENSKCIN
ncbi:gamma-interferon-inducible lysosomal thiol reductase-like [Euwallacea similis]|uniref:gamma-interferon-inducible lysosomal thiol reductase-like n=1 Tax=Euwallacea similis TaxID=1736056 RepID=UPI0034508605